MVRRIRGPSPIVGRDAPPRNKTPPAETENSKSGAFGEDEKLDEPLPSSARNDEEAALPLPFYDQKYVSHLRGHFANLKTHAQFNEEDREAAKRAVHRQRLWIDTVGQDKAEKVRAANEHQWAYTNKPDNRHKTKGEEIGRRLDRMKRHLETYANSREATREELWRCMKVVKSMHELRQSTALLQAPKGKTIYVPEAGLVRLFGTELELTAGFTVGSGCDMHVRSKKLVDDKGRRQVVLIGSEVAVKLAEKEIEEAVALDRLNTRQASFTSSNNGIVRAVWSNIRHRNFVPQNKWHHRRPVDVPRPSVWTQKSLADYIEDLVHCGMPESQLRQYYSGYTEFFTLIADMVLEVLNDPAMQKLITSRIVHTVVPFFVQHQSISELNKLIPLFDGFMTTRTFNSLMKAASKRRDLFLFRIYINIMRNYGLKPNGFEVVQFLKCIVSNKIRSYMLLHLQQQGFLDEPHVKKAAVSASLQDSFLFHMTTGQSVSSYIRALNDVFDDWVSTDSLNNMVLEATYAKNPEAIAEIVDYCKQNDLDLDSRTLVYGLMYFAESKRFVAGIKFFLHMVRVHNVRRKPRATQLLFLLAWRRRAYNVCRLVWRYACLEGCATKAMQKWVYTSILRNTPSEPTSNTEFWSERAGKVITGVETDLLEDHNVPYEPVYLHENRLDPELLSRNDREVGRRQQLLLAKRKVAKDLQACENFEPLVPFESLIERAMELDDEWGKMQKPADWIFENAIRVPVISRSPTEPRVPVDQRRSDPLEDEDIGDSGFSSDLESILFDDSIIERRVED